MLCARNPFPGMFCRCFKFIRGFSVYWLCFGFIEAASRAIVQFLEINQSEEASRGWMLLTTINLLASSGQVSAGVVRPSPPVLSDSAAVLCSLWVLRFSRQLVSRCVLMFPSHEALVARAGFPSLSCCETYKRTAVEHST